MSGQAIHPSAFIGDGVELGMDVSIGPFAVILGPARIGDRVYIGAGSCLGAPPEISTLPQNRAWAGELDHHGVIIEDDVVIREGCVVHQGSHRPTTVGQRSWLLNRCYLAHDVQIGQDATISAGVSIGGHAQIRDRANLGMNAVVHQRRRIGAAAMVGMGSAVSRDIPPYSKAYGVPVRLHGVNAVGMRRAGLDDETIAAIERSYAAGDLDPVALPGAEVELAWWAQLPDRRPVAVASQRASADGAR